METITALKALMNYRKLFTAKNFQFALKQSMILSGVLYFFNTKNIISMTDFVSNPKSNTTLLLELIATYFSIIILFYALPKIVLRYFIHSKLRDKIRIARDEQVKNSSFTERKNDIVFASEIGKSTFQNVMKLGLLNSKDINQPIILSPIQKEEVFNFIMDDLYKWITLILHTGITLIVVYDYYSIWFIIVFVLAFMFSILFTVIMVFIILNLESLEYIRRDLVKRSKLLM